MYDALPADVVSAMRSCLQGVSARDVFLIRQDTEATSSIASAVATHGRFQFFREDGLLSALETDRVEPTAHRRLPAALCRLPGGRPQSVWLSRSLLCGEDTYRLLVCWADEPGDLGVSLAHTADHIGDLLLFQDASGARRSRETRLAVIIDALPMAIVYFDDAGAEFVANRLALALLGLTEGSATLASISARIRDLHPANVGTDLMAFERTLPLRDVEIGGRVYAMTTTDVAPRRGGGRLWSLRDVTEARRQQTRLQQARRQLLLGQIAGGVGHEFNNLLGKVIALAEVVIDQVEDRPGAVEDLEALISIAEEGGRLVGRLAAYSGASLAESHRFDATEWVRAFCLREREARALGLDVGYVVPAQPVWIDADPTLMEGVLVELVSNAVDAGASRVEVSLSLEGDHEGDPVARLTFHDNGHGADAATSQHVFDPFFTTRPVGQGVGLGLSMVRGVLGQFGGTATFDSVSQGGATVTLSLPLAPAVQQSGPSLSLVSKQAEWM